MKRLALRLLLIASILTVLLGFTSLLWYARERPVLYFTDADTIRRPIDAARLRDVLWRAPVHLGDDLNSSVDESEPAVTADGTLLLFSRGAPGGNAEIMFAERTPTGWTEPRPLAALNSDGDDLGPEPAPDGRAIYFYSNRGGGAGGYDLWCAERTGDDAGWTAPRNLGPAVNSRHDEYGPALTPDGTGLYFASNRPRDPGATEPGDYDVYLALLGSEGSAEGPGDAQPVAALNSPAHDGAPAVSPVGDFVYLGSDRPGGNGGFDLYRSRRIDGTHLAPENLGTAVNTPANELDPSIGLGGFGLHFSSDRARVATEGAEPPRDYDLYRTTSREVFAATEYVRAEIDWRSLVPYLGWLILGFFVCLLLWILSRVVQSERYGKLSLLMRCLLASMITHVLLLILFGFWGVGTSLADWAKSGGGVRVAIVSTAVGSDLSAQVRGSFTDLLIDAPDESTPKLAEAMPAPAPALSATEVAVEAATIESEALASRDEPTADAPAPAPAPPEVTAPAPVASAERIEIDLPVAPGPSREVEQALLVPVQSPPAPARSERAEAVESATAREVTLAPADEGGDPAAETQTLVAEPAVSDARPRAEGTEMSTARAKFAERPAPIAPDLSLPAGARAATTNETDRPITVRASEAPRLERPVDVASGAAAAPEVEIAPEAAPDIRAGAGLILSDTEATDAALWPSLTAPTAAPPAAIAAPRALAAVEVPALPASTGSRSAEGVAGVATNVPSLRPLDTTALTPAPSTAEGTGRTELAPLTPAVTARASLVPTPAADADPAASASAAAVLDDPRVRRSDPTALALPALEEDTASRGAETTLEVAAAERPRATRRFTGAYGRQATPVDRAMPLLAAPAATERSASADRSLFAALPRAPGATSIPPVALPPMQVDRIAGPPLDIDLQVPAIAAPNPQEQRAPKRREALVEKMGGSKETEEAVARALAWLARHQSEDGHWDGDGFDDACGACGGATAMPVDVALTGLSLLCFFGTDHTHVKESPYRETVERALDWLLAQQSARGDLLAGESMYSHGIATIALAEAYGMTGDERLREPVERAVRFIVARSRREGGWRYAPRQAGDTSVLGWQIMALSSAQHAGIEVPAEGFAEARSWLRLVTRPEAPGLYAYQPDRPPSPAMTAESMFVQQLIGQGPDSPGMAESASYVLRHPPTWNEEANTYYWYYATLALYQHQDWMWNRWNERIKDELLAHQETRGGAAGSWEPVDQWAQTGGRIYQTAICTLTLEVYYRYLPRFVRAN